MKLRATILVIVALCHSSKGLGSKKTIDCREIDTIVDTEDAEEFLSSIGQVSERKKNCHFEESIDVLINDLRLQSRRGEALKVVESHANTILTYKNLASKSTISSIVNLVEKLSQSEKNKNQERSKSAYRILR